MLVHLVYVNMEAIMKKERTTAILLASAIMMSLVGCNGSTSGSGEMEYTEAELRQAAREAMIATENSSASASSVDASTASSSATEATTESSTAEASTTASSDAATTGSSEATAATTDVSAATTSSETQTAQAIPAKLADHQFVYNGRANSIMNDIGTIMSDLGRFQFRNTACPEQPFYSYDNGNFIFITGILAGSAPGDELPLDIAVYKKGVVTARNVGVGSTLADINNAYNGCNKSSFALNKDYGIKVKFDSYTIYFYFDNKTDTVKFFSYENDLNMKTMYPVKADIEQSTYSILTTGKASANSGSNSNATQATNTPAPAANNTAPAQTTNNTTPAPAPAPAATATQNNVSVSEAEVIYNGKKLSILDNASTLMANLGQCEKKDTSSAADEPRYVYDSDNVNLYTFISNGEELSYDLCIYKQGVKASRNVGVGDSKDAIIAAYGSPTETYSFYQGYGFKYKFDTFTLYFDFDTNTDKVHCLSFGNNATIAKRHAAHPDYIGD